MNQQSVLTLISVVYLFICLLSSAKMTTMVSAEIFGFHQALLEKKPEQSKDDYSDQKLVTSNKLLTNYSQIESQDISISHPFLASESSERSPIIFYPIGRRVGFSTIMLSSLLYGITIIPALLAVSGYDLFGGSGLFPLAIPALIGAFAGKRRKRSLTGDLNSIEHRLIVDYDKINSLVTMLESPFGVKINKNNICRKIRLCQSVDSLRQNLIKLLQQFIKKQFHLHHHVNGNNLIALPKFSSNKWPFQL